MICIPKQTQTPSPNAKTQRTQSSWWLTGIGAGSSVMSAVKVSKDAS
jgi:hypothetical protein